MIITIDGTPGSGKNSIGEKLAKVLGYKFYSMGDLMRHMATRKGITLVDLNRQRDKGPTIDKDVDDYQRELGKEEDNFVITGRTSYHFIPHALKVFLKADYNVAASRIWPDLQKNERNEGNFHTEKDLENGLKKRNEGDRKRYLKYYKLDVNDSANYDFALNTSNLDKKQVYDLVLEFVKKAGKVRVR